MMTASWCPRPGPKPSRRPPPGSHAPVAGPVSSPVGRLTLEDAYAYAKFARIALGSNDIDMRARPHSAEEAQFIAAEVAGHGIEVSYRALESASVVLLAGFEPEEESPIVFLRLRKAARKRGLRTFAIAPFVTPGLRKMSGQLIMSRCPARRPRYSET